MAVEDTLFPAPDDSAAAAAAALLQLAEHGTVLADLDSRMATLECLLLEQPDSAVYRPVPAPRWWKLDGTERQDAIGRLADWVAVVYRPSYGKLASRLPDCWQQHNLCLFVLDFLSNLHSVLYLRPTRSTPTVSGQAEFHTRLLPVAAELMADETRGCGHGSGTFVTAQVTP
jgi:hypothetical protein